MVNHSLSKFLSIDWLLFSAPDWSKQHLNVLMMKNVETILFDSKISPIEYHSLLDQISIHDQSHAFSPNDGHLNLVKNDKFFSLAISHLSLSINLTKYVESEN